MTILRDYRSWGLRLCAAILIFGLVAGIACGQATGDNSRTIIEDYFKAARAGDWQACALTVHPSDLGKFKGTLAPILANIKESGNPADALLPFFVDAKDWDGILAKDSLAFFTGTMSWISSLAPQIGKMIGGSEIQIVGSVDEGTDTRHFVFHMKLQDTDVESNTAVITVRRSTDKWMVIMGGTINQLAGLFRRA